MIFDENVAYKRSKDILVNYAKEEMPIFEDISKDNYGQDPTPMQEDVEGPSEPVQKIIVPKN